MDSKFFYKNAGMPNEKFEYVPGYDKLYIASTMGYAISMRSDKILDVDFDDDGYKRINLKDKFGNKAHPKLHKIIAITFLKKPTDIEKPVVDHINGDCTDNRLENLRYCTYAENSKNAYRTGNNPGSGKIICKLDSDGNVLERYVSISEACRQNDIKRMGSVGRCLANPDKDYTASGFGWRYSKLNVKREVVIHEDEEFREIVSKKYGIDLDGYELSNYGLLRNAEDGNYLNPRTGNGYHNLTIRMNGKKCSFSIHRLVAILFLDDPNDDAKTFVNHIDENKKNNYYKNLEWVTPQENAEHSIGKIVHQIDLKTKQILNTFNSIAAAARHIITVVTHKTVRATTAESSIRVCCQGKIRWAYGYKWKFADIVEV